MTTHIGLLRAINLAGHNRVAMADLCELLEGLGMQEVKSLLQSGNVVFRCSRQTPVKLEGMFQSAAAKRFGFDTDFFVRTADDWKDVIASNPFTAEAKRDPAHLLVAFLKDAPDRKNAAALQAAIVGHEVTRVIGRQAYTVFPDGVGRSKLTTALFEKKLGTRATARNWNTVLKLGALAGAS